MTYKGHIGLYPLFALALMLACGISIPAVAGEIPRRAWLAGRYDGNRIVVYFDGVKFGSNPPMGATNIPPPVADAFFSPVAVLTGSVVRFQNGPRAERFAIGDHYDLLLGGNGVATITLSTLVGFLGDEQVGNDSYIGALATPDQAYGLIDERTYYAVTRHLERSGTPAKRSTGLVREPVRFDIESRIAAILIERMKLSAADPVRRQAVKLAPAIKVQSFALADGRLRYYARAAWKSEREPHDPVFALAAWIAPSPTLHILAVEHQTPADGFENELPNLRNVVSFGEGRTAIVVSVAEYESQR